LTIVRKNWNGVYMASLIHTASVLGLEAHPVQAETDISPGLGAFLIVGLPDTAVQEARERVKSALKHAGIKLPTHPSHH
jgi:magnesium chelatase family protein